MNSTDAPIYLDYNATTPLLPEVVDAIFNSPVEPVPVSTPMLRNPSGRPVLCFAHVTNQM
jgi:hypothetical protein